MVFPQTALPIKVELLISGVWTDVTSDVRGEQQIRITRGRQDEASSVEPTRCQFTLDNNSGKYSPRNPTGVYYGSIGRNTRCRVSVLTGDVYLDLTGSTADYAETADTAVLDITGDIDVRVDMSLMNWMPPVTSGDTVELMGKLASGQKSWMLAMRSGRVYFEWSADGTNSLSASSTIAPTIPGTGRLAVRATLDVNNGSGGNTVTFWTSDSMDGVWVQLGNPVVQSGTTSIFSSTTAVRVGNASNFIFDQPVGRCHSAQIYEGIWGTVRANPYFSSATVGAASFVDGAGRTWTMNGGAQITNRKTRFYGEISSWPVRWETKFDVVVPVEASGVMRRLSQGASPVRSAIYREFTNPARTGIVAYWPMEDGATATSFASALDGEQPMTVTTTGSGVTPASYSDWTASDALPTLTSGRARGQIPSYTPTNYLFHRFFAFVPTAGVPSTQRLYSFTTTGTARTWNLYINTTGDLDLRAYNASGTQILATGFNAWAINGKNTHIGVELTQNGANIGYALYAFYPDTSTLSTAASNSVTGTLAANTFGVGSQVRIGQDGGMGDTAIGHIAVADDNNAFANTLGAMVAYRGEEAVTRIYRLGEEDELDAFPAIEGEQEMGNQGLSTLLDLMRQAEAVDGGILSEGRDFIGFRYRDYLSLLNQMPSLTLDYTGDDGLVTPLEPVDDDQQVRNDVTVARTGGSSARITLDTGTLSTQTPPDGVGKYDESLSLNLFTDDQPLNLAGWKLHLGTWDETRFPVIKVMLSKATDLIDDACDADIGNLIRITNPPSWLPPDAINLMVQGYTETLDQYTWDLEYNCTPAGPWTVGWTGDDGAASAQREFAWMDTAASELAEDLSTTEGGVDIFTSTDPVWTSDPQDSPYDLSVGGEVMTVTAPGSLINENAFFDTDANSWTAQNSTITRSTTYVMQHPRAIASLRIVPDGVSANGGAICAATPVGSITPNAEYVISGWFFSANGRGDTQPCVDWLTSASGYISTGLTGGGFTIASSQWTYVEHTLTAPATASRAQVRILMGSTPAASDILYAWGVRITRLKASWLWDKFGRTVANSWSTSDSGSAWSTVGGGAASDYLVTGGVAQHVLSTVDTTRRTAVSADTGDMDIYCDMTTSAAATGDSLFGAITMRMLDANNMYMARLEWTTGNAIVLSIRKMVAGVQTQLGTFTPVFPHAAGTFVRVRFMGRGSSFKAKVWRVTDIEPDTWQISATDTAITAANQVGTRSIRVTGNTNAATVNIQYDNYDVINPQTFTVTRSQNRVVKAHTFGDNIQLTNPAITAL